MKVKVVNWTIDKLYSLKDKINEQPRYQRGEVWKDPKKRMLIDSILRGIDIPKIYLRKLKSSAYNYEVADGQQRLNALWQFIEGNLYLDSKIVNGLDLSIIRSFKIGGMSFKDKNFPKSLIKSFYAYPLTIAIVEDATPSEIRTLFGRLQLGEPLVPAEKRNAIISQAGIQIDNIALNHSFFQNSRIPESRYKHQDYLAHVFALIEYKNAEDLKAELLLALYLKKNPECVKSEIIKKIACVLDIMYEIDMNSKKRIVNKFAFIDIFWFLYNNFNSRTIIDVREFAFKYDELEKDRIENNKKPEDLIKKKNYTVKNKNLYDYIIAFNLAGALTANIEKRQIAFSYFFKNFVK